MKIGQSIVLDPNESDKTQLTRLGHGYEITGAGFTLFITEDEAKVFANAVLTDVSNDKPEYIYLIDGKQVTEKQYSDSLYASCFIEIGKLEKVLKRPVKSRVDTKDIFYNDIEDALVRKAATLDGLSKVQVERYIEGGEFIINLIQKSK